MFAYSEPPSSMRSGRKPLVPLRFLIVPIVGVVSAVTKTLKIQALPLDAVTERVVAYRRIVGFESLLGGGSMYQSYFGMKVRPFGTTPQLGTCYPASTQQEALATLNYAITQGIGFGLLTGEPGTGKTLVCHQLSTNLQQRFTTAMITNTNLSTVKALLQAILYDLSLPFHGLDEQELRLTLTDFILGKYAGGGRTVLVIDEAQNLSVSLLEELRMLNNLESQCDKLFQVILAGHPRILRMLRSSGLETLSQRIGARAVLEPLSDEETFQYIQHQLQCAGATPGRVFTDSAMESVYEGSAGVPRLINQLCERAMLLAYVSDAERVDAKIVERALTELEIQPGLVLRPNVRPEAPASSSKPLEVAALSLTQDDCDEAELVMEPETVSTATDSFVACTQCQGQMESLEIVVDDIGSCPSPTIEEALGTECENEECSSLGEAYEEEEVVLDPYAMMDAARSNPGHSATSLTSNRPTSSQLSKSPTIAKTNRSPVIEESPATAKQGDVGIRSDTLVVDSTTSEVAFVEASDNPAVHEVGAGIHEPIPEGAVSPILVIENRSERLAGNMARLDVPQKTREKEALGYRRLFSHARKN